MTHGMNKKFRIRFIVVAILGIYTYLMLCFIFSTFDISKMTIEAKVFCGTIYSLISCIILLIKTGILDENHF